MRTFQLHPSRLNKSGDPSLGTPAFDGLLRLAQGWRFNAPTLHLLVEAVRSAPERLAALEREHHSDPARRRHEFNDGAPLTREFIDARGAVEVGRDTYAGSVTVVLSSLLQSFKSDLDATQQEWETSGPRIGAYSVGRVIEAAANNVRHADEWAKHNESPTPQQLPSIKVLASALDEAIFPDGFMHHLARSRVSAEVLAVLGENFDTISAVVFAFAHDVAQRVEARTAGGPP